MASRLRTYRWASGKSCLWRRCKSNHGCKPCRPTSNETGNFTRESGSPPAQSRGEDVNSDRDATRAHRDLNHLIYTVIALAEERPLQ
jgi:hypothetical protein